MGRVVARIVLTGGPCAGKTTALSKISSELTKKGYKVLVVGESASELISGGIKCFGDDCMELVKFQELLLKYQYEKEKMYNDAVSRFDDDVNCVIIYDRGLLDNKAYINQDIFNKMLLRNNLNELNIMDNYDMVVHLVTAADGKMEAYTLSNNMARTEDASTAIELDKKTVNAWMGHSNLRIIGNDYSFGEKLDSVMDEINNLLDFVSIRKQRKFLIDLKSSDLSFLNEDNSTLINIFQLYFDEYNGICDRIRARHYNGGISYYFTKQEKMGNGVSRIFDDKRISKIDYLKFLRRGGNYIYKNRYFFTYLKQYFRLDIIDGCGILEVEPRNNSKDVIFPDSINIIDEVTKDERYDNHVMAKKFRG